MSALGVSAGETFYHQSVGLKSQRRSLSQVLSTARNAPHTQTRTSNERNGRETRRGETFMGAIETNLAVGSQREKHGESRN